MTFDRPLPSDPQAEASVIAALMVDPNAASKVQPIVSAGDFYHEQNAWTYPNNYDPPANRNYFVLRMSCNGNRRREVSVGHLSDEELAWVDRVIQAEKGRRNAL